MKGGGSIYNVYIYMYTGIYIYIYIFCSVGNQPMDLGGMVPRWGNPRLCWCYSDEDLVGQIMEVGRSCHPSTIPEVALFKFATLLSIESA